MAQKCNLSEKLVFKLASHTEKNLCYIQRIDTFWEKSHRNHIQSAKFQFLNSLMYWVFEKKGTGASEKKWSQPYAKVPSNYFLKENIMQIFLILMLIEEYKLCFHLPNLSKIKDDVFICLE